MANIDRPNGFKPVKTLDGSPWASMIRYLGVTDGADLFVGDTLILASNLAAVGASNSDEFLGVAVGFGKVNGDGVPLGMFNPDSLTTRYYDDSASTHTEWVVYYVPFNNMVFEAQTATALTYAVGSTFDLSVATSGNTTTGISGHELTTSSNAEFVCVEIPKLQDNNSQLVWGRYWVTALPEHCAFHA